MSATTEGRLKWSVLTPPAAALVLAVSWGTHPPPLVSALIGVALIGAVLSGVHHAEVVAHRVGEPFGSLLLAVAVTVIEVGLIVMLMVGGSGDSSTLARDTVFAAVMITVNGIVGLCLLVASVRHHLAVFNPEGAGSALATVITLAGLTMVVPVFTTTEAGPVFSGTQLAFAAIASLVLYGTFVFTQTVRHRDFFLPVTASVRRRSQEAGGIGAGTGIVAAGGIGLAENDATEDAGDQAHAQPPTTRETVVSAALLVLSLVTVVGLAKVESYAIEDAVSWLGFPQAVVGVVIAMLVLAPETIAAVRAAVLDRVQTSLNLAYGSAMASIGLTIPVIAVASIWLEGDLALGLEPLQLALLFLSAVVGVLTVVPGRSKPMHGVVHLVLFAAFLFLTVAP
ncbi:ionic transporter y4hA [Nocardioides sp. zg-536]|uniref:Ionic transporter y4hA n=1 Tax=Nocardioides faecalis TaxID=2803858 RepID=A0A938XZV8_9ACTN|nr:ionic transporter y4hA [Nocardioides faecalis]MBM9459286.1 ionic transporter y4hA [Nocardioides faecalis]MBS4751525.1 ionic transporter y4hA [Nocardioides faecalis]QVI59588.1 ionic transporter y4hA [Nocardioides faecalis]